MVLVSKAAQQIFVPVPTQTPVFAPDALTAATSTLLQHVLPLTLFAKHSISNQGNASLATRVIL
jgi:hypothetical protein